MNGIPWGRLVTQYERGLRSLFGRHVTRARLIELARSRRFKLAAEQVAIAMVRGISGANAATWRTAALRSLHSQRIFEALNEELRQPELSRGLAEIARENTRLIRSVPIELARQINRVVRHEQARGSRAGEIEQTIRELVPHLTANKIRLIARTEVAKAETAVTRVRSEELGLEWFQWQTSEDQRVRKSHRNMDKVLVRWNDLPSPEYLVGERDYGAYAAGGTFNCRCVSLPLVSLDEISWPARVYRRERITTMTRDQFARLSRWREAA